MMMMMMIIIIMHQNQLHYVVQTNIPWVQKCVIKTVGHGSSHKYTNIQICSVKFYSISQKQNYNSSLHKKNSSTG